MRNCKSLIALLLIAAMGIVGLTIAYFSNSTSIENKFETSEYGMEVTEIFKSPDNWQPGDETPKVLTVTNSGEVDEAVRIKVEEKWVSKNGDELPLSQNGNVVALINYINSNDWTRVDVDGEDYYYYYYNYKLAPNETTTALLDKVTFNPLTVASISCQDNSQVGEIKKECYTSGNGYDGAKYTLKFTIETVQHNQYASAWGTTGVTISSESRPEPPKPASEYLLDNATNSSTVLTYNDASADKGKMFAITHNNITDYRYIGNVPNNYAYFNCTNPVEGQTYNYANSCEVWRILGVFDVDNGNGQIQKRIKLIRGSGLATPNYWDVNGKNDWTISSLRSSLNSEYYNGLNGSTRELIGDAKHYLGAITDGSRTAEDMYGYERGTVTCGACNNDESKFTSVDKVGLMYASDYFMAFAGGVSNECYSNSDQCQQENAAVNWIYSGNVKEGQNTKSITLLISFPSIAQDEVFTIRESGIYGDNYVNEAFAVRPTVYLNNNVKIIDGDGTINHPYVFEKMQ